MDRLRFVFAVDWIRRGTGGFASLVDLMNELRSQGHDVLLLRTGFTPRFWRRPVGADGLTGLKVLEAPGLDSFLTAGQQRTWTGLTSKGIRELIVLLSSLPWVFWKRRLLMDAMETISRAHVFVNASSLSGAALAAIRSRGPLLVQNHAGSRDAYARFFLKPSQRFPEASADLDLYTAFCSGFDVLLFQSGDQADETSASHPLLRDRTFTLRPSADLSQLDMALASPSPFSEGRRHVVIVGTIQPRKSQETGVELVVAARKAGVPVDLHLLGGVADGEYAERLRERVRLEALEEHIHFHGHTDDFLHFMAHADALLQTSEAEGVSRAVREAMYLRLPVVSFRLPGLDEYLGEDGAFLADSGDKAALSDSLIQALADPAEVNRRVTRARAIFDALSSPKAYSASVSRFVDHLKTFRSSE